MTLGPHQRAIGTSQVHITPRHILAPLGPFDLDPAGADPRPWDCAAVTYTEADDGLAQEWAGRVWLNPPFDRRVIGRWLDRMADHAHGVALIHVRTETAWFGRIWNGAWAILFLGGRVIFHKPDGSPQTIVKPDSKYFGKVANSGAPVALAAFSAADAEVLAGCGLAGAFVPLILPRSIIVAVVAVSWRRLVAEWLRDYGAPVRVADLYLALACHPKTKGNLHWRAKIRQTLQRGAGRRVARNQWVSTGAPS